MSVVAFSLALFCCCGDDAASPPVSGGDAGAEGAANDAGGDAGAGSTDGSRKVDLLFAIDNSVLMVDKERVLADSVARLFEAIHSNNIHVGVLSSSLESGGDFCSPTQVGMNDHARLIRRAPAYPDVVPGTEAGFLSLGPDGSADDRAALAARTKELILGASEYGCPFESQLEAVYRFVAQPDPPLFVGIDAFKLAQPVGVDYVLLAQRKVFFRPDSVVAIVMVTDEDDSSLDPYAEGGTGYGMLLANFPGSKVMRVGRPTGTTAARGTTACETDPGSAACQSCGLGLSCDPTDPVCQQVRNDPVCKTAPAGGPTGPGYDGFYAQADDNLNIRLFDMKRRFGIDPHYPIGRYIAALTGQRLPDRTSEHPSRIGAGGRRIVDPYTQATTCSNPLLSANLPAVEGDELCNLPTNGRDPADIIFGFIGGVAGPALVPDADWTKLLGASDTDRTGIDPHMIPSTEPRVGLLGADLLLGDNGSDPVHGREWRTQKTALEFACTYALDPPRPSIPQRPGDCAPNVQTNPPLCGGPANTTQLRASAEPAVRELRVAKSLGAQAVVGSVCDVDPQTKYGHFVDAFARRVNASRR